MKYRNTRGEPSGLSFEESLFIGWLPDGGLLMPETVPTLTKEELQQWSAHSYQEICLEMFKIFAGDDFMKTYNMKDLLTKTHTSFPEEVIPLKKLNDESSYVLELYHGPTHSFKDVALSVAGPLLNLVLEKQRKQAIVYVATSGDTGSAVINSTKGSSCIDVITMFPGGDKITDLQRLLMSTVMTPNIHNFTADCSCDPFDVFFANFPTEVKKKYPNLVVTSLNSLTWIRILMQACHVVHAYFKLANHFEEVTFVIPTGGSGHLTGALIAKQLGLPIKLVCAFNDKNLNQCNFLNGGEYVLNLPVTKSRTCAMDIQMAPNLERVLYLLNDRNVGEIKEYMDALYQNGSMTASDEMTKKIKENISTIVSSDDDVIGTMKRCWQEENYLIDPHTACGLRYFYTRTKESIGGPTVYMGCASPIKFTDELQAAGIPIPQTYQDYFDDLKGKEEKFENLPADMNDWMQFLLSYIDKNIAVRFHSV